MSDPLEHLSQEERRSIAKKFAQETLEHELHQLYLQYRKDGGMLSEQEFTRDMLLRAMRYPLWSGKQQEE
jgi:hypothetical protein